MISSTSNPERPGSVTREIHTAGSEPPDASEGFQVTNWRALSKGALRGFFTVTLPSGLVIHQCCLFEKDGRRWVGMPSQKFVKSDGVTTYTPLVEFTDREAADDFRDRALEALGRLQSQGGEW